MICGNDAVSQRVALTGQNAIAQGIALGLEILMNSSPERAKSGAPPPEKFRPFRAKPFRSPITQGDALCYRMLPRWGNPARRFSQIVMRGSIFLSSFAKMGPSERFRPSLDGGVICLSLMNYLNSYEYFLVTDVARFEGVKIFSREATEPQRKTRLGVDFLNLKNFAASRESFFFFC